jgi:hypothetical protein
VIDKEPQPGQSPLFDLPTELIDTILSYLSPGDLVTVSETCRKLRRNATSDIHWLRRIQANIPGATLTTPYPCQTYQALYAAHDTRWFLPKYKIWFCDRELMGKLVIVRYDQRRGCIEGYQLLAISNRTTYQHWPAESQVIIHGFEPQVKLHIDKPVLQLHVKDKVKDKSRNRFSAELPMSLDNGSDGLFSNFLLARPLESGTAASKLAEPFPYDSVWPPPAIPARHRVAGEAFSPPHEQSGTIHPSLRPTNRADTSDQAFRIRHWMEMTRPSRTPSFMLQPNPHFPMLPVFPPTVLPSGGAPGLGTTDAVGYSVHMGEEVDTYSTLDPKLYNPTAEKPWRGIWVGDYSGHGCEFLLINQPDDPVATDEELGLVRGFDESDAVWERRRLDARVYRGRLEAIKLTGDPNVPRGEYTFVADELGEAGFVGIAQEPPFQGTRVVQSKGHVARAGFQGGEFSRRVLLRLRSTMLIRFADKYIESQLLLISNNRLAQYWVGFGHISFFERVDIDQFLKP